MDQLGIIFALVRKSQRNGKKTSACRKNVLRNYALCWNSVKSVQMRSFFWSVFFCIQTEYRDLFSPNTGKYGPKKALYLDTFYAVYIQKNKDFEIQFLRRNKWVQQYITLHMKVGCVKWHILLVSANWQFWKLSGVICS